MTWVVDPIRREARIAGLWYLLFVLSGFFALMYVPGKLVVRGNPAATADNIASHELLFRLGIAAELLVGVLALIVGRAVEPARRSARSCSCSGC